MTWKKYAIARTKVVPSSPGPKMSAIERLRAATEIAGSAVIVPSYFKEIAW